MLPDSAAMTDDPAAPAPDDHPPEPAAALTPPEAPAGHPTEEVAAPEAAAPEPPAEEPAAAAEAPANGTAEAADAAEPAAEAKPAEPDKKSWYVVKVQSGREESIKEAIERRVRIEGLEEYFGQIIIPVETVTEMRNNRKVKRTRKLYPGYLMCEVEFNDRILYLFRETSGVGDFVGGSATKAPTPMSDREVQAMLGRKDEVEGKIVSKPKFDRGDRVRVKDGTFAGMEGEVKQLLEEKNLVRVELTIFGRPVPVELEYWQVEII
jgi:transcription termination/antitermination protein NusG